jgi:hypothetical protein
MDLKAKLQDAKKSTKIAMVGGVIVVAGSWGSCQFELGDETASPEPAVEAPAPEPAPEPAQEEPAAPEEEEEAVEAVEG